MKGSLQERFDDKWVPEPNTGCHLWLGALNNGGYSRIGAPGGGAPLYAHRVSWELVHGAIPLGLQIDHLCRTRSCVNPSHLRLVTQRQNLTENSNSIAALHKSKTECAYGHPFDSENTIAYGPASRWRLCRECNRRRCKARYWAHKES